MRRSAFDPVIAILAALASTAGAAEPERPTHACAVVRNDTDRLACYDATFGRPADAEPIAPAADPATPVLRDFGFSEAEKLARYPDEKRELALEQIDARITAIGRRATGEAVITLDNGQVWLQAESLSAARLRVGDQVVIRKAALGSFQLLTPGKIAMRVRRVK